MNPPPNLIQDVYQLPASSSYSAGAGCLGVVLATTPATMKWYNCREQFHGYGNLNVLVRYAFMLSIETTIVDLADFIHKVERVLGIIEHSRFQPTQTANAIWVEVSPFWLAQPMRHQLFTILLRCSLCYREAENNFYQALFSHPYIESTRKAVERFCDGFTNFVPNGVAANPINSGTGWVAAFSGAFRNAPLTAVEMSQYLVKP